MVAKFFDGEHWTFGKIEHRNGRDVFVTAGGRVLEIDDDGNVILENGKKYRIQYGTA